MVIFRHEYNPSKLLINKDDNKILRNLENEYPKYKDDFRKMEANQYTNCHIMKNVYEDKFGEDFKFSCDEGMSGEDLEYVKCSGYLCLMARPKTSTDKYREG